MSVSETTASSDDTTPEGPVIRWVEAQGWSKADVELLVSLISLVSLVILAYSNLNRVID